MRTIHCRMTQFAGFTTLFQRNDGWTGLPYSVDRTEMHRASHLRLLAGVTLVSFCFFCIFLAVFMLPDELVEERDFQERSNPYLMKLTRVVQAIPGSSHSYHAKDSSLDDVRDPLGDIPGSPSMSQRTNEQEYNEDEYYDIADDDYDPSDEDEDDPENGVFRPGDFDYSSNINVTERRPGKYAVQNSASVSHIRNTQQMFRIRFVDPVSPGKNRIGKGRSPARFRSVHGRFRNVSLVNFDGIPIVEDRIYWSEELEDRKPEGVNDEEMDVILKKLRSSHVLSVHPPTWNQCGRPKNLFVVFEDGAKACARYRAPHQYLVQGEVLSFYMSRLLGIHNVPPVAVLRSNSEDERWSNDQIRKQLLDVKWEPNVTVALIQWIDDLERDKMPPFLLSALINHTVISAHDAGLYSLSTEELVDLVQWSDLIVFDYITGNYDRVASMQDAADKEHKPAILNDTIHNLVRSKTTKGLWLIDNESGLLDSYSLLYGRLGKDGRFLKFHREMLNLMCVFRRSTAERIRKLHESRSAGKLLMELVRQKESLFSDIENSDVLFRRLQSRISEIHTHIEKCYRSV